MMTASRMAPALTPDRVHETLGRHILADGYDMVLDIDRSHGRRLWDARRGPHRARHVLVLRARRRSA